MMRDEDMGASAYADRAGGAAPPSRQEASQPKALVPSAARFHPSRIPWQIGASDESYGTMVWASRVDILRGHLQLLADYLPEDADWWLRGQFAFAIKTAEGFLRDWSPLCDSDGPRMAETPSSAAPGGAGPARAEDGVGNTDGIEGIAQHGAPMIHGFPNPARGEEI